MGKADGNRAKITKKLGPIKDHRDRLLTYKPRGDNKKFIEQAHDDEWVFEVETYSKKTYSYPAGALNVSLQMEDLATVLSPQEQKSILQSTKLRPEVRYERSKEVEKFFEAWIYKRIDQNVLPNTFFAKEDIELDDMILLGNNQSETYSSSILHQIKKHGIYKTNTVGNKIDVSVISTQSVDEDRVLYRRIEYELSKLGYQLDFKEHKHIKNTSRVSLEKLISTMQKADILLCVLPAYLSQKDPDQNRVYQNLKELSLKKDMISQVVCAHTITNDYAYAQIIMGILAQNRRSAVYLGKRD